MKKIFAVFLIIVFEVCCCSAIAAMNPNAGMYFDDTMASGEDLGDNYLYHPAQTHIGVVLCDKLFIHETPENTNETVVFELDYDTVIQILQETDEWLYIDYNNGTSDYSGWVLDKYILQDPSYFIAQQPTPIYASMNADSKILSNMDTYDGYHIVDDIDNFYIISFRGGVGFVKK